MPTGSKEGLNKNSSPDYQKKDVITIMATKKNQKDNMKNN